MPVSRSGRDFLKRHGMVEATSRPAPRLDIGSLLAHHLPLTSPPQPSQEVLQALEGCEVPDRGATRPWPGEVASEEES